MCGIAGIYGGGSEDLIGKMLRTLSHRGPDGQGKFSDGNLFLGHTRLAIVDLSESGHQPMFNEDRSVVIVVNGEIYNAPELKDILVKKGHLFRSTSDSEVILHLYEEVGFLEMIRSLNGMFAFTLYDLKTKTVFLGRDRLGIKQLYYGYRNNRLIFSSEIKAIIQDPQIPRKLNYEALTQYLTFQNILNDGTFFEGIKVLLPGTYIEYDGDKLRSHNYWQPEFENRADFKMFNFEEICEIFREKACRSVSRHLLSDVPLGTYLSGGFDSSTVTYYASKLLSGEFQPGLFASYPDERRLPAFTGRFDAGPGYDESHCARELASQLGLDLHQVTIGPNDFSETIQDIIYHLDEPRVGVGSFSQYMVAREVARDVKVVLTGHGGDEFFSGYPVFKVRKFLEDISGNPLAALKAITKFRFSEIPHLAFFGLLPLIYPERKEGLFILFDAERRKNIFSSEFKGLCGDISPLQYIEDALRGFSGDSYQKLEWLYIKTYLSALFTVEDKISMAHSLESRTPFCDNEMFDFAMSLPPEIKLHNHTLKAVIKYAMKGQLPGILYNQPKKGFPTPLAKWIKGPLRGFFQDILSESSVKRSGIFDPKKVQTILNRLIHSPFDTPLELVNANRLWAITNVLIWKDIYSVSV